MNVPGSRKPPSASPPVQAHIQPRGPHQYPRGQTPPISYRPQLSQEEIQQVQQVQQIRGQVYHPHQQAATYAPNLGSQGGLPHDPMNKQPMAAPHVPQQANQQQAQPGIQQVMYHPHSQQAAPRPSYQIPRQSVPQHIRTQTGQRAPLNMSSSPAPQQPMYSGQPMQTMFMTGQQPGFVPGQQVIIQSGPPPMAQYATRAAMQGTPQYTINTAAAQQPYQITSNPTPAFYSAQPQSNVFYAQPQPNYSMQQQPRMAPPAQPYQKRERKILTITDPNTGRNLNDEILQLGGAGGTGGGGSKTNTPPQSGSSSSRATPITAESTPPPGQMGQQPGMQPGMEQQQDNNAIAAQFAAQVAATLRVGPPPQQQAPPPQAAGPHPIVVRAPPPQQAQPHPQHMQAHPQQPGHAHTIPHQQQIPQQGHPQQHPQQPHPQQGMPPHVQQQHPAAAQGHPAHPQATPPTTHMPPTQYPPHMQPHPQQMAAANQMQPPPQPQPIPIVAPATLDTVVVTRKPPMAPVVKDQVLLTESDSGSGAQANISMDSGKQAQPQPPQSSQELQQTDANVMASSRHSDSNSNVSSTHSSNVASKEASPAPEVAAASPAQETPDKQSAVSEPSSSHEATPPPVVEESSRTTPPSDNTDSAPQKEASPAAAEEASSSPSLSSAEPTPTPAAAAAEPPSPATQPEAPKEATKPDTPAAKLDSSEQEKENAKPKDVNKDEKEEGKETRKKSHKQKMRELNQKDKEGSDMDAFAAEESGASTSPAAEKEQETIEAEVNNIDAKSESDSKTTTSSSSSTEAAASAEAKDAPAAASSAPAPAASSTKEETSARTEQSQTSDKSNTRTTTPPSKGDKPNVDNSSVVVDQVQVEIRVEDERVAEKNEKNVEKKVEESAKTEESSNNIEEAEPVIKKNKTELKYKYREDQWSPVNVEGKKHYDRNFLLQLQFSSESVQKPEGLPRLPDVILDKPISARSNDSRGNNTLPYLKPGNVMDFTPGFFKSTPGSSKGPGGMGGRNRSQQKNKSMDGRRVITHTLSMNHEVKLQKSENAWKPQRKTGAEESPEERKTREIFKKVISILNKLTPQKFTTLIQQIQDLEIDTEERLTGTIERIFEKAIDEPNFSVAYANMCKCMVNLKVPAENKPEGEFATFRILLLNRCQREFEKDKAAEVDQERRQKEIDASTSETEKKKLIEEAGQANSKAKRRSLGNIRFIGELFKLRMLTEGIMHQCLFKLLKSNDEDSLECLCRLLTTIGKDIDHVKGRERMDQYFAQMEKIIKGKKTSSRTRFMLQDVVELRKCNWVPRREDNNPKTIAQIHKEASDESERRAAAAQNIVIAPKQSRGPGRQGGRGPGGSTPGGEDGWNTVTKTTRNTLDPSRMKLTKQNVDENIQLGPGGRGNFGAWGRGSSGGGGKSSSQEQERPQQPNRFQALSARNEGGFGANRAGGGARSLTPNTRDSKGRPAMPAGRGKMMPRASQEQEREAALATVRSVVGGRQTPNRTPTGSRNQSRDSSRNREERAAPVEAPSGLSEDEMTKKTKSIIDEYLHINDLKEAIQCVKELNSPKSIHVFVSAAVNHVLERSPQARKQTGALLHDLVKQNLITVEQYLEGIKEILEFAEDMEIDIPKIWQYLGELIGPMVQDGSVPLSFLTSACEPLVRCNKAGVLVAEVLHNASSRIGHKKVGELWRGSGLQWSVFLGANADVQAFLKKNKLEFTETDEPMSPESKVIPIEKISQELTYLLEKRKASNEIIFDWIEGNVGEPRTKEPQFVRALMTAVCNSAIVDQAANSKMDPAQVKQRSILLQKYLDHQGELELQALYALQALVHKLDHPRGLLRSFFDTLYDEDIISEDAFNAWDASNDPAEQTGKGVAKNSVVQFFTWLREAEDDDDQ